jgi:ABC-2 type transport system permease protein
MRLFWIICSKSIQKQLAYRTAALAGLVTNLFFGFLRAAVLIALYGTQTVVTGISLEGAITYTGITQAIIGYLSLFNWYELMNSVYTGAIATDLVKPLSYYRLWLAQDFGRALAQLFLRGAPIIVIYALVFRISYPTYASQWLLLLVSLLLAWSISFSWRFLLNLSSFWVPNATGILRFGFLISWFLSGFLMPIRYFPDWFQKLCYLTPFPHMINTIVEIYLGVVSGFELLSLLLLQAAWAIGLMIICKLVLWAGIRRLVILGG